MAREDYVPVTGDDWYERRRNDAEGRFWRQVSDQGPHNGPGTDTRQGIYFLTADGQLLGFKNAGQHPAVMREALKAGLAAWNKLPAEKRKPGAIQIPDVGPSDARFVRTLPPGGVVIRVFTRALEAEGERFGAAECPAGAGKEAARDHLWLTRDECQSLLPADPRVGGATPMPPKIVERIARFHLIDNTRGEPPSWERNEIRSAKMSLVVERASADEVVLRLDGAILISSEPDASRAHRGYDAHVLGYIAFARPTAKLTRFDMVALGDHWGEGPYTQGARPGRTPLGVSFELAGTKAAGDDIPPQGARWWEDYMGQ
jgi:hypothetical protein